MKPSDISLRTSYPPLVDTMGKSELEIAAAMLVRTCQLQGDEFAPKEPRQIGEALKHDAESNPPIEPLASLARIPVAIVCPDFRGLVAAGFARWTTGDEHAPIEFTQSGLDAISKHCTRRATK
jgi:hypothetical protein